MVPPITPFPMLFSLTPSVIPEEIPVKARLANVANVATVSALPTNFEISAILGYFADILSQ
ncbi:hypothetical protein NL50_00070 [Clostridium acetobutylicum]|nr:hypothetical protein NL50_00070 [Clostridium acetobutylicum]